MSTDLRHTPVVGGEEGYVDFSVRPDLSTLRRLPWQPDVAWCIGDARTVDGSAPAGTCARGLLERVVARYGERDLSPIVGPELEFFLLERDPDAPGGLRRYVDELSRVYTVGAISDPRGIVLDMLYACEALDLARLRREPRVHELAVRDQHRALRRARRGRPRVPVEDDGEGARGARGDGRDVHGQAVQ